MCPEQEEIMNNRLIVEEILLQDVLTSLYESAGIIARPPPVRQRQSVATDQPALLKIGIKGYEHTFAALVKPR
jgi:hypothetical protein